MARAVNTVCYRPRATLIRHWYQCQMLQQSGRFRAFDGWRTNWQTNNHRMVFHIQKHL